MKTIPIIVGVTGHRDPVENNISSMKNEFRQFLDQLSEQFEDSDIIVATGLARGCDTYAIEAAIEVIDKKSYKYIGVLPMPRSEYEKDFTDDKPYAFDGVVYDNELSLFNRLCDHATYLQEGPFYLSSDQLIDMQSDEGGYLNHSRDIMYEAQGKHLAEQSDYLVAFYDQSSEMKIGGTAHVLKMRFTGESSPELNRSKLGEMVGGRKTLLISIKRKSGDGVTHSKALSKTELETYTTTTSNAESLFISQDNTSEMDKYNQFNKKGNELPEYGKSDYDDLPTCEEIKPGKLRSSLEYINHVFSNANRLSMTSKSKKGHIVKILFILIMLSIVSFEAYGILGWTSLLAVYISLYVIILVGYKFVFKIKGKHHDFVEYRVLAELLRIQYYWHIAGLNKQISDYFPLKSRETMGWVKQALRSVQMVSEYESDGSELTQNDRLQFVCDEWITEQRKYYNSKQMKHEKNTNKGDNFVKVGFGIGFMILIAVVVLLAYFGIKAQRMPILLLVSFSGFIAAATALYSDKINVESFDELSQRYAMMTKAYSRAENQFKDASITLKKELIFEIGIEAMNEQSDWFYFQQSKDGKIY